VLEGAALLPSRNLKILAKKVVLLISSGKTNFTTFAAPLEIFWKNPLVAPSGKNPSDAHASNIWKLLQFGLIA